MKPGDPNEIVRLDTIRPLQETNRENKYILVMVDRFTKRRKAIHWESMDAQTVTKAALGT